MRAAIGLQEVGAVGKRVLLAEAPRNLCAASFVLTS